MSKDPAFLFYSQDFFLGTSTMSYEDRGKYITILCVMHQQGRLTEESIRLLVGSVSVTLRLKFKVDKNGLWYNERLEEEIEKRKMFVNSRKINGSKGGRPKRVKPSGLPLAKPSAKASENLVEDENEIENVSIIWNKFAEKYNLPQVLKLTPVRKSHIKKRSKEPEFNLPIILQKITESDFLLGKKTDFKANFDFVFGSRNNYIKILEDKYRGNNGTNKPSVTESELRDFSESILNDDRLK